VVFSFLEQRTEASSVEEKTEKKIKKRKKMVRTVAVGKSRRQ